MVLDGQDPHPKFRGSTLTLYKGIGPKPWDLGHGALAKLGHGYCIVFPPEPGPMESGEACQKHRVRSIFMHFFFLLALTSQSTWKIELKQNQQSY